MMSQKTGPANVKAKVQTNAQQTNIKKTNSQVKSTLGSVNKDVSGKIIASKTTKNNQPTLRTTRHSVNAPTKTTNKTAKSDGLSKYTTSSSRGTKASTTTTAKTTTAKTTTATTATPATATTKLTTKKTLTVKTGTSNGKVLNSNSNLKVNKLQVENGKKKDSNLQNNKQNSQKKESNSKSDKQEDDLFVKKEHYGTYKKEKSDLNNLPQIDPEQFNDNSSKANESDVQVPLNQNQNGEEDEDKYYESDFEEYESDFEDDTDDDDDEDNKDEEDNKNDEEDIEDNEDDNKSFADDNKDEVNDGVEKYENGNDFQENIELIVEGNRIKIEEELNFEYKENKDLKLENLENRRNDLLDDRKTKKSSEKLEQAYHRGKELLEIIKLNTTGFSAVDIPPVDYDLFIKTFGRKNTKQIECQVIDRKNIKIQTEIIDSNERWTQHPPVGRTSVGDAQQEFGEIRQKTYDPFKLLKFIQETESIVSILLDCEYQNERLKSANESDKITLKCLLIGKNCPVTRLFANSIYLFSVQNILLDQLKGSLISVWNVHQRNAPEKTLVSQANLIDASASQRFVVGAMIDGSVCVWDLNEDDYFHKEVILQNKKYVLRCPSFNTAGTGTGHENEIVSLTKLKDNQINNDNMMFSTLDAEGTIIVWLATESLEQLNGASPMSKVKLNKLSQLNVKEQHPNLTFYSTCFTSDQNDFTQFYVGTDLGLVVRCSRQDSVNDLPSQYEFNSLSIATTISWSEYSNSKFFVGYNDGSVCQFFIEDEHPIIIFESKNFSILHIQCCFDESFTFASSDSSSCVCLWNIDQDKPVVTLKNNQNKRICSFVFLNGIKKILALGIENGNIEIVDSQILNTFSSS